ncbi:hypothetical protein B0H13DRAFT_1900215 [Mycena leptocephala]|nr:hypothetical protein B0H13DRAFT_1900215 [Mycena leptocephala]
MSIPITDSPVLDMVLEVLASSNVDWSDSATVCSLGKLTPREYDALATRNGYIVGMVRDIEAADGSTFAGWDYLARIASNAHFPSAVVAEVVRGTHLVWVPPRGPLRDVRCAGNTKKGPQPGDLGDSDALMALGGLVDYDFDCEDTYSPGFAHATARHNRGVQRRWIARELGTHVHFGAATLSVVDWVTIVVADSASLSSFGYESAAAYTESRLGMFSALLLASTYDLLYDRAISNLAAAMMYVPAAGMAHHNMHCIFATTVLDAVAKRISGLEDGAIPLYGDNTMLVTATWTPFNIRYHTWERFVKYSRQITRSSRGDVHNVEPVAKQSLVLPWSDIADAWRQANTHGAKGTLIPRITARFILRDTPVEHVGQLKSLHFFLVVPPPGFYVIFKFATQSGNSVLLLQVAFLAVAISLKPLSVLWLSPEADVIPSEWAHLAARPRRHGRDPNVEIRAESAKYAYQVSN